LKQQKTRQSENSIVPDMKINKYTSVWKESEEEKRQRIELLLFPKQQNRKREYYNRRWKQRFEWKEEYKSKRK